MNFDILEFLRSLADFTVFDYVRSVWGDAPWLEAVLDVVGVLVVSTFALLIVFVLGWGERKILARIQDRIGPNRVGGRYGLLQMVADVVKMMTKEVIIPSGADLVAYLSAPALAVMTSLLLFAVLPFAPGVIGVDLNVGVFYVLAISSVSVVAILLAGWGSNNKYALLGAFRGVAQLVSYEVPMIIALLVPILLARSMSTVGLVEAQTLPFLFFVPLSAGIFLVAALAETGRTPFDLLEAESEIVAGFHTEYSGMNFGLFMAAEYISALFMSALFVTAYLGGYRFFGVENVVLANGFALGRGLAILVLAVKTTLVFFIFMWVRGTLPRFRIDQMLNFSWKFLVPLSLVVLFVAAVLDKLLPADVTPFARAGAHLISNVLIGLAALEIIRRYARQRRLLQEDVLAARARSRLEPEVTAPALSETIGAH